MLKRVKRQIIACHEDDWDGLPPATLRQVGISRVAGRLISDWKHSLGTYGMGGPGFVGFELASFGEYQQEWLVLTLWGASEWLLLDGRWVSAHPNRCHIQQPWWDWSQTPVVDDFCGVVVGSNVAEVHITNYSSMFNLRNGSEEHTLQIPEDTSLLPIRGGESAPRVWNKKEHHLDAWLSLGQASCFYESQEERRGRSGRRWSRTDSRA